MRRTDRLYQIITLLRDGKLHRARDLATRFGVSERTIYRDMETLMASGVPVVGSRGVGYRAAATTTLPPLSLTPEELEALTLGLAVVSEAADPDLRRAALALAEKIDASQPAEAPAGARSWDLAAYPFADMARGLAHIAPIRAAITGRQKVVIDYRRADGTRSTRTVRPLKLVHWGRLWQLVGYCELCHDFREFRVDLIENLTALPALFQDEPGKALADYTAAR